MSPADLPVADIVGRAMVARIATVSRHGRPHVNPLYFVVDGGHVHLGTATFTLAARNVAANPEVEILFEVEADPADHRVLRMRGTAVVRTEPEVQARYRRAVTRKYILTPGGLGNLLAHPHRWRALRRHVSGDAGCVLDVTPTGAELLT